jgi:TonB family protein
MRSLARVSVIVMFVLSLAPPRPTPAATDTLAALEGHWHCTVAGRPAAERYYFLFHPQGPSGPNGTRILNGRQERVEPDGTPVESFEQIYQSVDGSASIESVEGKGEAPSAGSAVLRFTSSSPNPDLTLSYVVDGDTMQRVATSNKSTIDSERCMRVVEKQIETKCTQPNAPARALDVEEPVYPPEAVAQRLSGIVHIIVTLDDHSRVIWTSIGKSDNAIFNSEALRVARISTYRAEIQNCKEVAARYLFTVDFDYSRL